MKISTVKKIIFVAAVLSSIGLNASAANNPQLVMQCHLAKNPDAGYSLDIYEGTPNIAVIKTSGNVLSHEIGSFEVEPIGVNGAGITGYKGDNFNLSIGWGHISLKAQGASGSVNISGKQSLFMSCEEKN